VLIDAWRFEREEVDAAYGAYHVIPSEVRHVGQLRALQRTAGHRDPLCDAGCELVRFEAEFKAEFDKGIVCPVPTVMWDSGGVLHVACEEGWALKECGFDADAAWCLYVMYADCDPPDPAGMLRLDDRITLHGDRRVYVVG